MRCLNCRFVSQQSAPLDAGIDVIHEKYGSACYLIEVIKITIRSSLRIARTYLLML